MDNPNKHRVNKDLYHALMRRDKNEVIKLCKEAPENALHILTIHNDTVLHMATYSKQGDLVLKLLPECLPNRMSHQNDNGNTILHEAATTNKALKAAEKMLEKAPGLLNIRNNLGETAIFRAAHYGKKKMFDFLAKKISEYNEADLRPFLQRDDKTTVLHISILFENFELALIIAKKYEYLIPEPDGDGMTGLQLLSCNPSVFESRSIGGFEQLIYSFKSYCSLPWREADRKDKHKYESALKLAKILIEKDTSWEATKPGKDQSQSMPHNYGVNPKASSHANGSRERPSIGSLGQANGKGEVPQGCSSNSLQADSFSKSGKECPSTSPLGQGEGEGLHTSNGTSMGENGEIPLFLATKSGCVKIVEEILKQYPQAVEHVNSEGQNILHLAIKYRQLKIFNLVKKMKVPMRRLVRNVDIQGNSVLHMVGIKTEDYEFEKMQGPAVKLQEELLWLERVKKITITHLINHRNDKKETADGLFANTNRVMHSKAKEWLKRTSEGCSIVAVLIASVTFAAAYTVPGGPNQDTGFPILLLERLFHIFIVTNISSLTFALVAVVTFLLILTSPFHIEDFEKSLPRKLMLGVNFLLFSLLMMMIAFAATIILMIQKKESWTKVVPYALPVCLFLLSYFPLYILLSKTFKYVRRKNTGHVFPWSPQIPAPKITNCFKCNNIQSGNPSNPSQSRSTNPTSSNCPPTQLASSSPV